jgi:hypothetical protein
LDLGDEICVDYVGRVGAEMKVDVELIGVIGQRHDFPDFARVEIVVHHDLR